MDLNLKKYLNYLTGLGLVLWYIVIKFEKYSEYLNPFLANVPTLYPLKTPENLWFSGVFTGYKAETLAKNGLITHVNFIKRHFLEILSRLLKLIVLVSLIMKNKISVWIKLCIKTVFMVRVVLFYTYMVWQC